MTEPCPSTFYHAFVAKREPISPQLMAELAQARLARQTLVVVAKWVVVVLYLNRLFTVAIILQSAINAFEDPLDMVDRAQNRSSNTPHLSG